MMKMAIEEESEGSQKNWLVRKTMYAHMQVVKRLTPANAHYTCILREIMQKMKTLKMVRLLPLEQILRSKKGVNIYKVFKHSQAEKYECRVSQESTKNFSEKEKSSISDYSEKKLKKASPSGSAKTSLNVSSSESIDEALKNFFEAKNAQNSVEIEEHEIYAKEEIFSSEEKESRKTLFSMTEEEIYNKFENMSDDLDSVLCLPYDNDGIYEHSFCDKELIFNHENQGTDETNDELSGLLFNAEQTHLNKRGEFEFLDFEGQQEQDLDDILNYKHEIAQVEAPFALLF